MQKACVRARRLWAAGILIAVSCTAPDDDAEVPLAERENGGGSYALETDSQVYTLQWDGRGWFTNIGFRYRNEGPDTLYIVNCNQHVILDVQKRTGTLWTDFWMSPTNGCISPPILIPPDSTYTGVLPVWGAKAGTTTTTAFASDDFTGAFRLRWNQLMMNYTGQPPRMGDTLPNVRRVSNEFSFRKREP